MKLKTTKNTLTINNINYVDGKLNVEFTGNQTCEELPTLFRIRRTCSVKNLH